MKRAEAKSLGLKTYNTGKPCKHGRLSDRYTSTAICIDCVRLAGVDRYINDRDAQYAAWRKWYEANKEVYHSRYRRWQRENAERVRETAKAWEAANPDKVRQKRKNYIARHPDQATAMAVASVARRAKRVPQWMSLDDKWMLREVYALAKLRTKLFGFVWEVDHVLPSCIGIACSHKHSSRPKGS